jgi:hypothetical protein
MPEKKYAKYIVTEDIRLGPPTGEGAPSGGPGEAFRKRMQAQHDAGNFLVSTHMLTLSEKALKGAMYFDAVWMWEKKGPDPFQVEIAHSHEFDEVIGFFGGRREDPHDLDAEIELWLEDEQYFINKAALIFVPGGMKHLPLYFRRIGSPVLFFTCGPSSSYTRATGNE